ncbi:MAG: hypothetical protein CMO74_10560 [Verrucomicrobiales bacterium]|nr:hypothetical protein [Verrucomicrobiales bacterium]MBL68871.1 hypothetical protein [Verrucomicrobiales bacterium]|tara:strand:+ start:22589 stop:23449 length:861 start_codon:yes stop_codon:yes gene_type:complete
MSQPPLAELRPLLRGLNALLIGLPLALVVCIPGAVGDWIRLFIIVLLDGTVPPAVWLLGLLPVLGAVGLLVVGVWQMARFQPDDADWQRDLFHSRLFVLLCLGLAPFLYWAEAGTSVPGGEIVLRLNVLVFTVGAFVYLIHLNLLLRRLARLLPNVVLQADTRIFAKLNPLLLLLVLALVAFYQAIDGLFVAEGRLKMVMDAVNAQGGRMVILLMLPSVATTLSMIWKARQTALRVIFEPGAFDDEAILAAADGGREDLEDAAGDKINSPADTSCPADAARSPDPE